MERTAAVSVDVPTMTDDIGLNDELMQRERLDPADLMLRREDDAMIQQALESLPATYRRSVEMCDIEGLAYEQISEIMACPVEIVRSRVELGHLLLKKTIERFERRAKKPH